LGFTLAGASLSGDASLNRDTAEPANRAFEQCIPTWYTYMVYIHGIPTWYTWYTMVYIHGIYGIHIWYTYMVYMVGKRSLGRKTVKNIKMAAFGGKLQVSEKHKVAAFFPKRFGLDYNIIII
jgi:hypothetical protein